MNRLTPSVAWLNLTHNPIRLLLLLSGIVFAVVLMFMFTGFKFALYDSQLQLVKHLQGDVFLVHERRPSLTIPKAIPQQVIYQAQAYSGVRSAAALYVNNAYWKNLEAKKLRTVRAIAFNLDQPLFDFPELQETAALQLPYTALVDRRSRPEVGPISPGTLTELENQQIRVVGNFTLGNDFASENGNVLMSTDNFFRYFGGGDPAMGARTVDQVDVGVVFVESGYRPEAIAATLRQALPPSVTVLLRDQIQAWERSYWQYSTNIGFVFGLLTVMGFVIGIILCYQIIYADIADNLSEYATLKAMGYRNLFLYGVVFQESLLLAVMGFIPALLLTYGLYAISQRATGLIFEMRLDRSLTLLVMTVLMCFIAGLVSLVKVQQSDPAEVF